MNKKDEIKLEVLSSIDDNIIEKQTDKRYRLMMKNKFSRKKLATIISSAACFLIVFSMLFTLILPMLLKQVPVYQGMSISNDAPLQTLSLTPTAPVYLCAAAPENYGYSAMLLSETEPPKPHTPERLPDAPDLIGENRSLYYANKGEDIYIKIHIKNPDSFEILSFTLNGTKYQSYMFEDGSNSEELILKVNVGDAEGMVEYTIDAIKYIDGTKIKDVRMDGDKTVSIAVYPASQPTPELKNLSTDYESVSFDISISDPLSLIKSSGGSVYAALYYGDELIATKDVSLDAQSSVLFESLTHGITYTLKIIGRYDSLDGNGFGEYLLYEESIVTKSLISINNISISGNRVSFLLSEESGASISITKTELINEGGFVEAFANSAVTEFSGIALGKYTIRITYSYGGKIGYIYSDDVIEITKFGAVSSIVNAGHVSKEYSGDTHVYNPTTGDYRSHRGIDIITDAADKSVYALFSGTVTEVTSSKVVISSFDGSVVMTFDSLSAITLSAGDPVTTGVKLGELGATFDIEESEAPHVHVEITVNGEERDPMDHLTE